MFNALENCRNPLEADWGAVAPTTTNITLDKIETTARYARYRSRAVQATQEIHPDSITVELPTDREIIQAVVGGFTKIADSYGTAAIRKNKGIQIISSNMVKGNNIPVFIPDNGVGRGARRGNKRDTSHGL